MSILGLQVSSQKMVENLINDLMDLAKLDNSQFKIHNTYFNLFDSIYSSFEILKENAELNKVQLKATIANQN